MRVVGGIGLLVISSVVLVVGVTIGLIASIDCLMCGETNQLSAGEALGFFGVPIAFAAVVALAGARIIVARWLEACAIAGAWHGLGIVMLLSMLSS